MQHIVKSKWAAFIVAITAMFAAQGSALAQATNFTGDLTAAIDDKVTLVEAYMPVLFGLALVLSVGFFVYSLIRRK